MIQCNACELVVHCSWALVFSGVPEHRSLHFVCLHVMAQYKFPLQWLQSWVEPAEGFLFVHLVLCTQTDTFFVETPDEFTGQCLMLWVRTEHTNLGRLRSSFWCVSESSEIACETQLCNSSRRQLAWMSQSHLGTWKHKVQAGIFCCYKDICATVSVDLVA